MSVCEITIVGNVGRDPEVRYSPGGKGMTTLSVAVSQGTKQPDGTWTNETDWFRVVVFGEQGERLAETVRKGNRVLVIGRFRSRGWTDKTGAAKTSLEVTAGKVVPLDRNDKPAGGQPASAEGDDLSSLTW
ncbi:MAG: single-stranded DNA-binding protein [Gaiellales bacterium]